MSQQVMSVEDLETLGKLFVEAKNKLLGVEVPDVPGAISTRSARAATGSQSAGGTLSSPTAHGLGIGSLKS